MDTQVSTVPSHFTPLLVPVVSKIPTLCLNMIVKNESKIIERLLTSVAPWIDSYCICDTGSTDNTIELIRSFFDARSIPGKIFVEPFRDFGYNRTVALQACYGLDKADYILLLDADMQLQVNPKLTKSDIMFAIQPADIIHLVQGNDNIKYNNVRIVRNMNLSYWGVTHEYLEAPDNAKHILIDKPTMFIYDIGDGGSKSDKFERDVRLLLQGLIDRPNNARYTFYLANSYRDANYIDKAIEYYRKRITIGGWIEEVWSSHFNIGLCYRAKQDMPNAIYAWMEAYQAFPERVENLHEIIRFYRETQQYKLAYPFYVLAKNELNQRRNKTYLFMQSSIYEYRIDYEMTVLGYYCNTDGYDLPRLCMQVFNHPKLEPSSLRQNVLSNYKFYAPVLKKAHSTNTVHEPLLAILRSIGDETLGILKSEVENGGTFVTSTPCVVRLSKTSYAVSIRCHNYSIDDKGNYVQQSTIHSTNRLVLVDQEQSSWKVRSSAWTQHDTRYDWFYVGTEDIRIRPSQTSDQSCQIKYNGNRILKSDDGTGNRVVVEVGMVDATTGASSPPFHLHMDGQRPIEKNWVFVEPIAQEKEQMIYGWHPLTIGQVQGYSFTKTHEIATPPIFSQVRGSTNGQLVGKDELWFLCHLVSYEDRRYYYHMAVVLDRTTLALKKYTTPWTLEGAKVEYTLGFVYQEETDTLLIGYSVMDRTTEYIVVPKTALDEKMIEMDNSTEPTMKFITGTIIY